MGERVIGTGTLLAVIAVSLIAVAGAVFAIPGNWKDDAGRHFNPDKNFTGEPCMQGKCFDESAERGFGGINCSWQNQTRNANGQKAGNFTGKQFGRGLNQRPNFTQMDDFENAIEKADYETAKQLHEEYGLGGPLFEKLNETTFAKYAQIRKLNTELMQELGLEHDMPAGMEKGIGLPGREMRMHPPQNATGEENSGAST